MGLSLGVDVGGTKILTAAVAEDGRIERRDRRPTHRADVASLVAAIARGVDEVDPGRECESVGVSFAALLDASRDRILLAPNGGWAQAPLRDLLQRATGRHVVLENDGNCAAWGEARFGAGRGTESTVTVTVGTGIGGGIVIDERLLTGRHGVGAEIGHITMVAGGLQCGCGRTGCWEQYGSGTALVRTARELARERRSEAQTLLSLGDGTAEGITGAQVTEAAQAGDAVACAAFDVVGDWLGRGMADLAAVLDPDAFIVGGGVSEAGDVLLVPVRRAFAAQAIGSPNLPRAEVRTALLGNDAGVIGAADLARAL